MVAGFPTVRGVRAKPLPQRLVAPGGARAELRPKTVPQRLFLLHRSICRRPPRLGFRSESRSAGERAFPPRGAPDSAPARRAKASTAMSVAESQSEFFGC